MRLNDYLNSFSVDDLRELASRRRVRLSPEALKSRQGLVRALTGILSQYDGVYAAVTQLNQAELSALRHILRAGKKASLSGLRTAAGVDEASAKAVLESLRLWGLLFPEGDWEHIAIPAATHIAENYMGYMPGGKRVELPLQLTPPSLVAAPDAKCEARPGSCAWDLAEFTARVARSRLKLTQAGRINRRDLKGMATAFPIPSPGYTQFISLIAGAARLLGLEQKQATFYQVEARLVVMADADAWFALPEPQRTQAAAGAWRVMGGFPESAEGEPEEFDYVAPLVVAQRARILDLAAALRQEPVTLTSLAERFTWMVPLAFQQYGFCRDAALVVGRLARSLYWLGILALDDPEKPNAVRLTPLGARLLVGPAQWGSAPLPDLIPEEPWFFVQPNAESFAPPNLAPRTLFHLRRITGEKKGGAAGMFPLTADSVRRALDTGLTVDGIVTFLERFSRTGLPNNVRALVETAGRQHGRIRLVPAGYVLITDEPVLMEELRKLKTISPLIGPSLVERVAPVEPESVNELMRHLRARGYAPVDTAESGTPVALPADPESAPPLSEALHLPGSLVGDAAQTWDLVEEEEAGVGSGEKVTAPAEIRELLETAQEEGLVVEMDYRGARRTGAAIYEVYPLNVLGDYMVAYSSAREDESTFQISRINWARLTGETFAFEYL